VANTQSAQKRIRSNARKALRNKVRKSRIRSAVRIARESLDQGKAANTGETRKVLLEAVSELDRAAGKGAIHRNNASRRKSRLMKKLAALDKPA
jgi:small subunit ribosomal protein S20